ncbi:hypothetical protein BDZ89DRAFT_1070889 [Hymenopellis radicata]|nr:hypothetical protein BDZ89DRAFT_1070889 [Hymenopellis radicata]
MSDTTGTAGPPLPSTNEWVLKGVVPVLVESVTWTFSLSCLLLLIFLQVHFRRQSMRRNRILIMGMLVLMFCLTTLLYAMDIFWFFYEVRMRASAGNPDFRLSPKEIEILDVLAQTTLVVLMLLGDAIVLWRAVALSADNKVARRLLIAPIACLLAYLGTMPVALKCVQGDTSNTEKTFVPTGSCRPTVLANLSLSLLTNLLSTCIIAYIRLLPIRSYAQQNNPKSLCGVENILS